jgi:putative hydrolases of HD superfamily
MTADELSGVLDFLRASERLKATHRSAYTSEGQQESVAEHTWRLCLMAMVLAPEFPGVDFARLVKICLVHDLGEAVGGDVPAPEQARRLAAGVATGKGKDERRDLLTLLQPLPSALQAEIAELWDEYEAAKTPEARLAKALDKLETIMQHTQGKNPLHFDYAFNLDYGREHTAGQALIVEIRTILDAETARLAKEADTSADL